VLGLNWVAQVLQAIDEGDFFIACFSKAYWARDERSMDKELNAAVARLQANPEAKGWFIPVLLSDCPLPDTPVGDHGRICDLDAAILHENWDRGIRRIARHINDFRRPVRRLSGEADALERHMSVFLHALGQPLAELRADLSEVTRGARGAASESGRVGPAERGADAARETLDALDLLVRQEETALSFVRGDTSWRFRPYSLTDVVWPVVQSYRRRAAERRIMIDVHDSVRDLPSLSFDMDLMTVAFANLLDNAIKYSFSGQEARGRTVDVRAETTAHSVALSVSDYGLAIANDEVDRIFELGVRGAVADPRRAIAGSGLGLSVAEHIAKIHGGGVGVHVKMPDRPVQNQDGLPGALVTFTLTMPVASSLDGGNSGAHAVTRRAPRRH